MKRQRLILFTRFPEPGKTKTRLIPLLGDLGAAELQRRMSERMLNTSRFFASKNPARVSIWYADGDEDRMRSWLGCQMEYRTQKGEDLGDRMLNAFVMSQTEGSNRVVIVGTDCPGIDTELLEEAFQSLETHELVLGPARDGGYYLIGLREPRPEIFAGIHWGTEKVFRQTLQKAQSVGITTKTLKPLIDVDRPADVPEWERMANSSNSIEERISVIIPTVNEAGTIGPTLEKVLAEKEVEAICVDGGSSDQTVHVAKDLGAKVLSIEANRACRLNAAAKDAKGQLLLFLHADTHLPENYGTIIRETLIKPGTIAGAFRFKVRSNIKGIRLVEKITHLRGKWLMMPYGDQGLFLSSFVFEQAGGFADMPIMDDFELMRRLKRRGKIVISDIPAETSGRRWERLGAIRTTAINQIIIAGYMLGISPETLSRWYRGRGKME